MDDRLALLISVPVGGWSATGLKSKHQTVNVPQFEKLVADEPASSYNRLIVTATNQMIRRSRSAAGCVQHIRSIIWHLENLERTAPSYRARTFESNASFGLSLPVKVDAPLADRGLADFYQAVTGLDSNHATMPLKPKNQTIDSQNSTSSFFITGLMNWVWRASHLACGSKPLFIGPRTVLLIDAKKLLSWASAIINVREPLS
jgi:hypothetical protein